MERELWKVLAEAIAAVDAEFVDLARYGHRTFRIVRVYLWAALHGNSVMWATQPSNWPAGARERRPGVLPDQSTMSRRTRSAAGEVFHRFVDTLAHRLSKCPDPRLLDLKRLDGKPLIVAAHSKDRDATWGRGAGGLQRGYKFHALWGSSILPQASVVAPMNMDERAVARRLLRRLEGHGYVVADGNYDANDLYALASLGGYQLLAPRDKPGSGLGNRRQQPARLRSIELLERNAFGLGRFGPHLFSKRRQIEQKFGNLTSGVGALTLALPPFIRRIWRVRAWVKLKLLIYAARCVANTQQQPDDA
ncbi:MAG TPA: transposase [Phycisphaerae bacterium]|nr:transposase [Phycisphaerae bacterium]